MFIKNWHDTCINAIFQRQIDLKQSQHDTGWSRCSWTPSATSSSSTMGIKASTSYVHQKFTWHMLISYNSKTNRFKVVPGGSRWSRTPSATSSSSVMAYTTSTSYVNQNLTSYMFIYYYCKTNRFEEVPGWSRNSDILSDIVNINHDEYNKYQFCSSNFQMTHIYILFFKNKSF